MRFGRPKCALLGGVKPRLIIESRAAGRLAFALLLVIVIYREQYERR